jgi:ribokinase
MERRPQRQTSKARFDVALVADMCVDLILSGDVRPKFAQFEQLIDDYYLDIGGSSNVFACQAAKLNLRTAVIGRVGDDEFGRFVRTKVGEQGVDVSGVGVQAGLKTGIGVTLAEPSDRAILTYLGSIDAVCKADLPTNPAKLCRHWHIASYYLLTKLQPDWKEFLRLAKSQGVSTSLDPNWDPAENWRDVLDLLPHLDILFANDSEIRAIIGSHDLLGAARELAASGTLIVVKQGAEGALAINGTEVATLSPAEFSPVRDVRDTVGAGDNFDAGFLSGWLKGRPLKECLWLGHHCAAASLQAHGGIAAQITRDKLTQTFAETP